MGISGQREKQLLIKQYRDVTGATEITMHEVAEWAVKQGVRLPPPISGIDRLAKELSKAAREEVLFDEDTHTPYRANHAMATMRNGVQTTLWIQINNAPRGSMHKCLYQRREQMVGEALQLSLDQDRWNRINPNEEPIQMSLDLTMDVEWRKNAPADEQKAS